MPILPEPVDFEWDKGNVDKSLKKHQVRNDEAEEVFLDEEKVIYKDVLHSGKEERCILLGKTKLGRLLFVVFTTRKKRLRIISARDTNKREAKLYEKKTQNSRF